MTGQDRLGKRVAVLVRTFNSEATIGKCLESIHRQRVQPQIVVVDSGSTDSTLQVIRGRCDVLVSIPHQDYTPGLALNTGFRHSDADVVMPLSSHCALQHDDHIDIALRHHEDRGIAATMGASADETGVALWSARRVDRWPVGSRPWWGFSNHSCSIRRDVWVDLPFREDLRACEDKEWAARAHALGFDIVYDPALVVPARHRRNRGIRAAYRRGLAEGRALRDIVPTDPPDSITILRERLRRQYPGRYPDALLWVYPPHLAESVGLARGLGGS
ncbi:glycosyltransferase family 2 protein [Trujillonella humicola]|uniref:glycosyltransferase family 2 protein n=1 Tax=Trujillonella humicola TaxID=3383699 RepID=UPI0039066556